MTTEPSPSLDPVAALRVGDDELNRSPLLDPAAEQAERAKRALQVGGAMLIVCALVAGVSMAAGYIEMPATPIALIIDVAIGISLLRGSPKLKGLAIFRVVVGLVVYVGMSLVQADVATAVIQFALSVSLLLLLIGVPSWHRLRAGGAMCVAVVLFEVAALAFGPFFVVTGETFALENGTALGVDHAYSLQAGKAWTLRERGAMKAENPNLDNWLVDEERDAHVLVACARAEPGMVFDGASYFDDVVNELLAGGSLTKGAVTRPADGSAVAAGRAEIAGKVNGLSIAYILDTRVNDDRACALYAFSSADDMPKLKSELIAIVDSFTFR